MKRIYFVYPGCTSRASSAREVSHKVHPHFTDISACTRCTRPWWTVHMEDLLQICHPFQTGFCLHTCTRGLTVRRDCTPRVISMAPGVHSIRSLHPVHPAQNDRAPGRSSADLPSFPKWVHQRHYLAPQIVLRHFKAQNWSVFPLHKQDNSGYSTMLIASSW